MMPYELVALRVFHFPTFFDFQVALLDSGAILGQMNCDFFQSFRRPSGGGDHGLFPRWPPPNGRYVEIAQIDFFLQYGVENLILRNIKMRHFFLK